MKDYILKEFNDSIKTKQDLVSDSDFLNTLNTVGEICVNAYKNGCKVLICGNGGSASDAMHFVGEIVGRYRIDRPGMEAVCLNANQVNLTAIGNDYGYNDVFSRQLAACGEKGDVFIGISTSGNSKNINNAFAVAKKAGIISVGLLGRDGGEAKGICDHSLIVPINVTSHIQEAHILILHVLAGIIEKAFFE